MQKNENNVSNIHNGSFFMYRNIDLTDVTHVTYRYASSNKKGTIQIRMGSPDGPVISSTEFQPTGGRNNYIQITTPIQDKGGLQDLYFLFLKSDTPNRNLAVLDWIRFEGGNEVIVPAILPGKKTTKTTIINSDRPIIKSLTPKASAGRTGEQLIIKSDCATCHAIREKRIGPSYAEIANRYKYDPASINNLSGKIIRGGKGVWGDIPMIPHSQISKKDAELMVHYILSLKK